VLDNVKKEMEKDRKCAALWPPTFCIHLENHRRYLRGPWCSPRIAYAKANPGKINYASGGYGSAPNMAAELLKMMTGVDLVHVPYRGSSDPDMLAGRVQVEFAPIPRSIKYVRDGRLRALAVTSTTRSHAMPDIPAVAEFVPGYVAVLADPTVRAQFANLGAEPMPMTPDEFEKLIKVRKYQGRLITAPAAHSITLRCRNPSTRPNINAV
jgi:tripartite-type tricarboxylate transporter receptor subunit TctC